jgi:hypothetical protein
MFYDSLNERRQEINLEAEVYLPARMSRETIILTRPTLYLRTRLIYDSASCRTVQIVGLVYVIALVNGEIV